MSRNAFFIDPFCSTNVFNVWYPLLNPSGIPLMASLVFCSPSMLILIPTLGNSLHKAIIRSVKYPFVDITIRSDFLYSSRGYSGMVKRMLILWKERKRDREKTGKRCLSGSLKQSHILQRALHRYVTITVPYNVLLAIYLTPVFLRILANPFVRLPHLRRLRCTIPSISGKRITASTINGRWRLLFLTDKTVFHQTVFAAF